jgi:hypothetical protein
MTSVEPDRTPIFLDTAYVNALVNARDQWHDAIVQWQLKLSANKRRLVTTEFVLVEIADGLAAVRFRGQAVQVSATLQASSLVKSFPYRLSFLLLPWNCTEAVVTKIGPNRP